MGTSVWGLGLLQEENIIPEIIKIAEEIEVFSIRGYVPVLHRYLTDHTSQPIIRAHSTDQK